MNKYKIVHIINNDKFIKSFMKFIKINFNYNDHLFIFLDGANESKISIPKATNIININNNFIGKKNIIKLSIYLYPILKNSEKIILHSLFSKDLINFLFFNPQYLKKCSWIIWGGDLYSFNKKKYALKEKINEFIKQFCIKRFDAIIAYSDGDYERTQKWYKTDAKFQKCLYYPYFAVEDYLEDIKYKEDKEENIIMVGNSADSSNNHLEIFQILAEIDGIESYKVLCPLSYGSKIYAKKIIEDGYKYFGKNFMPLIDFMNEKDYYLLLQKVKIVIMGHNRQQATGNILALVKFGKKIYIRTNISTWNFYKENGITLYEYEKVQKTIFIEMKKEEKQKNTLAISHNFNYKRIIDEWNKILK